MNLPRTYGWQTWKTIAKTVALPVGKHVLRLAMDKSLR
jgi:hypothetical protein